VFIRKAEGDLEAVTERIKAAFEERAAGAGERRAVALKFLKKLYIELFNNNIR
jgi:hypothetical protein